MHVGCGRARITYLLEFSVYVVSIDMVIDIVIDIVGVDLVNIYNLIYNTAWLIVDSRFTCAYGMYRVFPIIRNFSVDIVRVDVVDICSSHT